MSKPAPSSEADLPADKLQYLLQIRLELAAGHLLTALRAARYLNRPKPDLLKLQKLADETQALLKSL